MKYLLLIHSNAENWEHPLYLHSPEFLALPTEERDELTRRVDALHRQISETGELVGGAALAHPVNAKTVRLRGGVPATTDGPYVETKEHLAGYLVVDCDSLERASEIAAQIPEAGITAVEVRPIMDTSGQEM